MQGHEVAVSNANSAVPFAVWVDWERMTVRQYKEGSGGPIAVSNGERVTVTVTVAYR